MDQFNRKSSLNVPQQRLVIIILHNSLSPYLKELLVLLVVQTLHTPPLAVFPVLHYECKQQKKSSGG